ncbi:hypothetical protein Tco_1405165, partial [Tanacetum coccineum]
TDISKITRKQSKTGKHGHGNQKSTKEAKDSKPKPEKSSLIKKKEKGAKGVFTIHPSLPNFTMVKREGKQELMGIKGNSSSLFKDSREKSVIPRLLIG